MLNDVCSLNIEGHKMLAYVAATSQRTVLEKYKMVVASNLDEFLQCVLIENHIKILANLAYDESSFDFCIDLIIKCILKKREKNSRYSNHRILISFFHIHYSGTNASSEQKLKIMKNLITSDEKTKITLGLEMLEAALSIEYYPYTYDFSFGSHNRDGGYKAKDLEEYKAWYYGFLNYSIELIVANDEISQSVQKLLSGKIRELCRNGLYIEVVNALKKIREKIYWPSGFIAINEVLRFDKKRLNDHELKALKEAKTLLSPKTIEEKAILYIGTEYSSFTRRELPIDAAQVKAEELGAKIATRPKSLYRIVYMSTTNPNWLALSFGRGVAKKASNHKDTWELIMSAYHSVRKEQKYVSILCGFIQVLYEENIVLCDEILNKMVNDPNMKNAYMRLQTSCPIDGAGIKRLKIAITSDLHDM